MVEPRHEHDCEACTFVGHDAEFDIYVCPQMGIPTVVKRWGSEAKYISGAHLLAELRPDLRQAAQPLMEKAHG